MSLREERADAALSEGGRRVFARKVRILMIQGKGEKVGEQGCETIELINT